MKGKIWNGGGLHGLAKLLTMQENIREHKLDSVALLETRRSNIYVPFLKHLAGWLDYAWSCVPSHGRSGGILARINTISDSNVKKG